MTDAQRIGERLRTVRGTRTQAALGRSSATPQSSICNFETGIHEPAAGTLARLAVAMKVSSDYLVGLTDDPTPASRRAGETLAGLLNVSAYDDAAQRCAAAMKSALGVSTDSPARTRAIERLTRHIASLGNARGQLEDPHPRRVADDVAALAAPAEEGQHVDVLEVTPAAGSGAVFEHERVTGRIKFRRTWLRRHGLVARSCRVLTVAGRSMEPTLVDGSSILVNHASRTLRNGRIFVVRTGDGLVVKRAVGEGHDWALVSDNPSGEWPLVPWPPDAEVVGEVKWAARTFA